MTGFAKHSLYSAVAGLSTVLASFVSGVIIANSLGVDGAGVVAFSVWIALVITPIIDGGTALCVGRFPADLKGQNDNTAARALPGMLARRLVLYNFLGVAALAVFYLVSTDAAFGSAHPFFGDLTADIPVNMAIIVAMLTSLQSFAMFGTAYLRGSQHFVTLAALTSVSMVAQIGCVYVGVRFYGGPGAITGYAVGQICIAFATLCLLWRHGTIPPTLIREVRRYGRFSWAANVCNTFVWSRIEILFLQAFWSYREVGLFSVALALSGLASQGPLLLTGAFLPMLAKKHGQEDRAGLQSVFASGTRVLAMLAFPACFGMAAVVPVLVGLLYGSSFEPAIPAAMIIVTAAAFTITTVIGTHLVNALARSDFIFVSSLVGAVLSAAVGFLLIPSFGLVGAAVSRALIQLVMIGLGLWFITTRLRFSYPFRPLLRILLAALVAALAAFLTVTAMSNLHGLIAAVFLAALVYLVCLRLFGAMHADDISFARRLSASLPKPFGRATDILLSFIHPTSGRSLRFTTPR
ncbi:lipopolysaccharide biosynthesis protein [Rhizobium herbae]|uniref:O-antigen/teichoic acid export membrane protein n=1 Tax=Rhizobium herbae TaxID=508661 RepID=A0ABS4EVQ9_9HYPH|nr:polysaccharide biosynthesis C-terminal domain-containing protein [Rhizobium herbae]MBP1862034.1 O-antigen/teichoic acid export membrane protein [Rhizobium herbae]